MLQKIKNSVLIIATLLASAVPAIVPSVAYAAENNITSGLCSGADTAAGTSDTCTGDNASAASGLSALAKQVVNVFSIIVGVVAVIMIIYGGFKYITSGGDSGNVSGAKNTLIYAIVGLIIVALAQFIVRFVLTTATNTTV